MNEEIPLAQAISIRENGLNESWLQEQIANNPLILGLGELSLLSKEKSQNSGGRLDILLKDSEDEVMYEVEVMLGETDASHIIRTIEYWDNEKRRWPQRQHYAVLVAEQITRRFFNVIHILSNSIPIIAIQVSLIQVANKKALFFTKVLDTFEEIDDGFTSEELESNRDTWTQKSNWTVNTTDKLLNLIKNENDEISVKYLKGYIAIRIKNNNCFTLKKRSSNKSLLWFRVIPHLALEIESILESMNMSYIKKPNSIRLTIDSQAIDAHPEKFQEIYKLIKKDVYREN